MMKFICLLLLSFTWVISEVQKMDEILLTKIGIDIQQIIKWDETTILAVSADKLYWIEIESKKMIRTQENSFRGKLVVSDQYIIDAITTDETTLQFDVYHRDFSYFNSIRTYLDSGSYYQILVAEKHLYFLDKSDSYAFLYAVDLVQGNTIPLYSSWGTPMINIAKGKVEGGFIIGLTDAVKDIAFFVQDSDLSSHEIKVFRPTNIQFHKEYFYISLGIATASSVLRTNGMPFEGINYLAIPGETMNFDIQNDKIITMFSVGIKDNFFVTDLKTNEQVFINESLIFESYDDIMYATKNLVVNCRSLRIEILNYKTHQSYDLEFQYSDPIKIKDIVAFLDTKEKMVVFIEVLN
ncbi:hypothetical protein [Candidatus Uabimicrobium amorphum]|uniref:Uncharacterized protein n=1 Tax=Uabimicrobium amorphum TaxID=2596890 RepID=A0A5S9F6H5_UABAM|nr:hypothetical protein [Candidatus Uabimicrobium amorphum]BBM87698.1 hypothetical protein UABAM_06113 [Candidatus Uabimicrobium amorphum]